MTQDARTLPEGSSLDADLCIVGGGVAGITLARELIGARLRVCLIESGSLEPDPETQSLSSGTNVGHQYYPLDTARWRGFGGSSSRWHVTAIGTEEVGARVRPLDAIDFEQRGWVRYSGWPFGRRHLDPYYDRADAMCRIGPQAYDVDDWENECHPRLPLAGDEVQTIIYKLVRRDLFAREFPEEVTGAQNITTCLHANVLEIETSEAATHVTRLRVATLRGNRFDITAKLFVLALGGIETPRLLLVSNRHQVAGLGNQHDLVGRFFMEHLHFWSGILVARDPQVFDRTTLYNDFHLRNGVAIAGKLALREEVIRRERLLNQNVQLFPRLEPDPFKYPRVSTKAVASLKALGAGAGIASYPEHLREIVYGWDDIARSALRRLRKKFTGLPRRPVFMFANMTEQVPNPESRVTLSRERDRFGRNRVQLDWKITPQDIRSVVRTQEIMARALDRAGVGRFYRELSDDVPPESTHGGYHHMGTTRMHDDPRQGVVDRNCRVHGLSNLYIAGPSVFPTGGYANPVLTTIALTLRLADHLKQRIGSDCVAGFVPAASERVSARDDGRTGY